MHRLLALARGLRPRQWLKNVLVATGPLAAGVLLEPTVWPMLVVTFLLFCATASGVYLVNDILDRDEDRRHPRKRRRPIASGALPIPLALSTAILLLIGGPLCGFLLSWRLGVVLALYAVLQLVYCTWLKHVVVVDLTIVSSGFVMRAIAGAVVADIALSQWFLLVMSFGSLFMVAGKRFSEKVQVDQAEGATRRNLDAYSASYLRFVWSLAAGITLISYSLWAFELESPVSSFPWAAISIVPFAVALLRYGMIIDAGRAGAPEETVLGDLPLAVIALAWLTSFALVVLAH